MNRKYKPLKKPKAFAYNIGSRDQNRELLFDRIGISTAYTTKTPSGRWALDKEVLANIQHLHPLPNLLQDYAQMTKFYGTYVKPFSSGLMLNEKNLFFPSFSLTGTVTGRFASDFQQWPRTDTEAEIKRLLVSRFGSKGGMINSDISQGEIRIFAIASKDKYLCEAFNSDRDVDIHALSAQWAFRYSVDEWNGLPKAESKRLRSRIKSAVTFGLLYGRTAFALSEDMGRQDPDGDWDVDKAQEFIDNYFSRFAGVCQFDHQVSGTLCKFEVGLPICSVAAAAYPMQ